jgi:fructose-specific PTS system IIA-like component
MQYLLSSVDWWNTRSDLRGNAKSALAIIATNTIQGDECQLIISAVRMSSGRLLRCRHLFRMNFRTAMPLPAAESPEVQPVPESLSRLNPILFHGRPVCAGSAGARSPG